MTPQVPLPWSGGDSNLTESTAFAQPTRNVADKGVSRSEAPT